MLSEWGFFCEGREWKGLWEAPLAALDITFLVLHDAYMSVFSVES